MRLLIAAAGRFKSGPERALFEHFAGRITFPLELKQIEEKKKLAPSGLKKREGELLLAIVPDGAVVVALDEKGKSLSSAKFAKKLGMWRDEARDVVFLIGGADGLDASVRARADLVIGFGEQTWPHLLVRGMLAEQIYRAECILAGHPYHRE
ncbi:MAG: 23S rRNA (pseudouridine(1915)-N(3))-methyltransferase RlmH [Rhodospirillales bacterium]|nr:23S rRNA (pseudouridine(1915)-N(3))-methyltransferase RlmH [Rhodospirillales bacterium]